MTQDTSDSSQRRVFLRKAITIASTAPLSTRLIAGAGVAAAVAAGPAPAADASSPVAAGYQCFSADEAAFVESVVNVMCPADEYTPSGVDCGLAIFMDRQLSGAFGQGAGRYMSGPWNQGKPQAGLQLPLTPEQFFKVGVKAANHQCRAKFDKTFDQLSSIDATGFLKNLSDGKISDDEVPLVAWFNDLIYPLFEQACFSDPLYGGNRDKVFWKMVGYPGLPATHTLDMVEYRGKPYPGSKDPKSIVDFS